MALSFGSAGCVVVKPVEILQGKWLGHSLHGAVVHVPVGAWLFACVLDVVVWSGKGSATLSRVALWCVGVGLVGVLAAVPTGLAEWTAIKPEKPAWKLALIHLLLNVTATAGWVVNFYLRFAARAEVRPVTTAVLTTSVISTLWLLASAYLGALMVFDHGIGVGRHSKKKWRAIAAASEANLPEEK